MRALSLCKEFSLRVSQSTSSDFSVEAEMNIREVNVNSQRTQILKEGRVVDQNSTTTKEVRFLKANVLSYHFD